MDDAGGLRAIGLACLALVGALMSLGLSVGSASLYAAFSTPALVASALAFARAPWAKWAAAPIFLTWLLGPVGIWLFMLGLSRLGDSALILVAATVALVAASAFGLIQIARRPGGAAWPVAVSVFFLSGLAQAAAVVIGAQGDLLRGGAR